MCQGLGAGNFTVLILSSKHCVRVSREEETHSGPEIISHLNNKMFMLSNLKEKKKELWLYAIYSLSCLYWVTSKSCKIALIAEKKFVVLGDP